MSDTSPTSETAPTDLPADSSEYVSLPANDAGRLSPPGPMQTFLKVALVMLLLYFFLVSIQLLGVGFKLFGKEFAENMIKATSNPVVGLFIGILATSLVQSSSTTTATIVGLVGAGQLPLDCAIPMIMGANIGTTVTNTMVSFGFVARKEDFRRAFAGATVHDFFNLLSVIVLFPIEMMFHPIKHSAEWLTSVFANVGGKELGNPVKMATAPVSDFVKWMLKHNLELSDYLSAILITILALVIMMASMIVLVKVLKSLIIGRAEVMIDRYLFRNDYTAFLLGIGLTIAVQSSSITTSLIVPMVGAGVVTLNRCYPFTLGANIGTTCTALLASLATVHMVDGKLMVVGVTAAFAHLMFNVFGIMVWYPLRRVPIFMAKQLADLAVVSKLYAVGFIILIFIGIPLLMMLLTR